MARSDNNTPLKPQATRIQDFLERNTAPKTPVRLRESVYELYYKPKKKNFRSSISIKKGLEAISQIYYKNEKINEVIDKHIEAGSHLKWFETPEEEKERKALPMSPEFQNVSELLNKIKNKVMASEIPTLIQRKMLAGNLVNTDNNVFRQKKNSVPGLSAIRGHKRENFSLGFKKAYQVEPSRPTTTTNKVESGSPKVQTTPEKKDYYPRGPLFTVESDTENGENPNVIKLPRHCAIEYIRRAKLSCKKAAVKNYLDFSKQVLKSLDASRSMTPTPLSRPGMMAPRSTLLTRANTREKIIPPDMEQQRTYSTQLLHPIEIETPLTNNNIITFPQSLSPIRRNTSTASPKKRREPLYRPANFMMEEASTPTQEELQKLYKTCRKMNRNINRMDRNLIVKEHRMNNRFLKLDKKLDRVVYSHFIPGELIFDEGI